MVTNNRNIRHRHEKDTVMEGNRGHNRRQNNIQRGTVGKWEQTMMLKQKSNRDGAGAKDGIGVGNRLTHRWEKYTREISTDKQRKPETNTGTDNMSNPNRKQT